MSKLFFIGNGFDLAHGLCTKYKNFRYFLINNYEINKKQGLKIPKSNNSFNIDYNEQATFLVNLIETIINNNGSNGTWEEFETYLGKIPYNTIYRNDDNMQKYNPDNLMFSTIDWNMLFQKWITLINSNCLEEIKEKEEFKSNICNDDLFFTTNYTNTLEYLYKISNENICHIHGDVNNPIFGHYEELDPQLYDERTEKIAIFIHDSLKKDVNILEEKNSSFFNKISTANIKEIIIYGNSLSKSDRCYLKRIISDINDDNLIIRFTKYDEKCPEKLDYKKRLLTEKCGFSGVFKEALY